MGRPEKLFIEQGEADDLFAGVGKVIGCDCGMHYPLKHFFRQRANLNNRFVVCGTKLSGTC
jgi:hypothetical protein